MEKIANEILQQLIKHYGKSRFYDWLPTISISKEDSILSGEFRNDWQEIVLYTSAFEFGPEQLATVINHEYIHYLQSPVWLKRYGDMYNYYENPYEIEAYQREEEWRHLSHLRLAS